MGRAIYRVQNTQVCRKCIRSHDLDTFRNSAPSQSLTMGPPRAALVVMFITSLLLLFFVLRLCSPSPSEQTNDASCTKSVHLAVWLVCQCVILVDALC